MGFSDRAWKAASKAMDLTKEAANKAADLTKEAANKAAEAAKAEAERQAELAKVEAERQAELAKAEAERQAELEQIRAYQEKWQNVPFQIDSGYQLVNASPASVMFQREDMTVFFNTNLQDRFVSIDYSWSGPQFETLTESTSTTHGEDVTKGKSGRMTAGAVIGTVLMPGLGTVVGTAIGAGGKKKEFTDSQSDSRKVQRKTEVLTPATLKFRNMDNNRIISIVIGCNTLIDSQIKCLQIQREQSTLEISQDTTEISKGINSLKELLDMGAITQEEFDLKKQQLLNP